MGLLWSSVMFGTIACEEKEEETGTEQVELEHDEDVAEEDSPEEEMEMIDLDGDGVFADNGDCDDMDPTSFRCD